MDRWKQLLFFRSHSWLSLLLALNTTGVLGLKLCGHGWTLVLLKKLPGTLNLSPFGLKKPHSRAQYMRVECFNFARVLCAKADEMNILVSKSIPYTYQYMYIYINIPTSFSLNISRSKTKRIRENPRGTFLMYRFSEIASSHIAKASSPVPTAISTYGDHRFHRDKHGGNAISRQICNGLQLSSRHICHGLQLLWCSSVTL